jgi:hypothetical protein
VPITLTTSTPVARANTKGTRISATRVLMNGLTALIALAVVIAAVEMIFAWAGIGESEYLHPDPLTGFDGIPNKSVTWRKEGFGRFRYNSIGMQDVEHALAKPANTQRVAFAGDSFVEALQVDRSLNFCSLLERKLNENASNKRFEMLNFGVSNSNLGQMYVRLKHKILPFEPDVVILGVRVDAAIHLAPVPDGSFLYASRPTFSTDSNGNLIEDRTIQQSWLQSREGKRMKATEWLRENSRIWGTLGVGAEQFNAWWKEVRKGQAHWGAEVEEKHTAFTPANSSSKAGTTSASAASAFEALIALKKAQDDATTKRLWPTADALIAAMNEECSARGCQLVLVRFCAAGNAKNEVETELLKQTAQRYQIPLFDTGPTFDEAFKTRTDLFYQGHFTPVGHRIFADAFYDFLKANSRVASHDKAAR